MASYLPLLLSSVSTQHAPSDDTSLSTQARGQVDYLSHEWDEDDIARSWRNMTRQKNEIANGPRLENASWRTWWKQRNKLKTISPETLNWLKDSDVTWLYGPLHTALDWSPPPKPAEDPTSVEKEHNAHDRLGLSDHIGPKKPILKHRTISELLVNALPPGYEESDGPDGIDEFLDIHLGAGAPRPTLHQTKSDTNVLKLARRPNPALRKDSPPRIIAEAQQIVFETSLPRSASSDSAAGSSDLNAPGRSTKRHITFNTYVEQCIAIDSPTKQNKKPSPDTRWAPYEEEDDGYDEDSEAGFNDLDDGGPMFSDHDSDDDEDIQLEISTPSSRSRSLSSSQIFIHQPPPYPHHRVTAPTFKPKPRLKRSHSSDKEHITIAPIAPTTLKTTGVGNHVYGLEMDEQNNLVYVPTSASSSQTSLGLSPDGQEGVYRHREGRFSIGGHRSSSNSSSRSPNPVEHSAAIDAVPSAEALPPPSSYNVQLNPPSPGAGLLLKVAASTESSTHSPYQEHPDMDAVQDYFGAAARAGGFGRSANDEMGVDVDVQEVETYQPPTLPEPSVVLQDEDGRSRPRSRSGSRSRSRSKSHSRSRTPSPAEMTTNAPAAQAPSSIGASAPVAIPRRTMSHESTLLSPPQRERRFSPSSQPRSVSSSEDGERERGRAPSRGAMSDRERSESRSAPGSPLGSVSPTGSVIGLQYAAYANSGRKKVRDGDSSVIIERGRASGRRSAGGSGSGGESSQSLSPTVLERRPSLDAVASATVGAPREDKMSVDIPDPIREEEERVNVSGESTPTPGNVPTPVPSTPIAKPNVTITKPSPASSKTTSSYNGVIGPALEPSSPKSPTLKFPGDPSGQGSLVGRAVSSAKGLIGSIW